MEQLIPIGRFSQMTRLSVKALRLYHEMGLLEPAEIDQSSGYRYYHAVQANRAEAIRILRSVDMPLDEIMVVLNSSPVGVDQTLEHHRRRLAHRLAEQERMLAFLERLIGREEALMPFEITVEHAQPQQVAAIRSHTTLEAIGKEIERGFGALGRFLGEHGLQPSAPPFIIYHDVIDQENPGDIEMCFPVAGPVETDGEVSGREVEGGPVATTVHRGPYREISLAYHALTGWIQERGHQLAGPPRETYLNDPMSVPESELLTRIDWPIDPAD